MIGQGCILPLPRMSLDHRTRCGYVAYACRALQPSILDYAEHQHEEHQNDQRKRQHHPHALEIAPLYLLVVRLNIRLAVLWALPNRPQLAVTVARRRLIQLALWRLERVDLRVRVVADSLKALGKARRVLEVVLAHRTESGVHAMRDGLLVVWKLHSVSVEGYLHRHCPCTPLRKLCGLKVSVGDGQSAIRPEGGETSVCNNQLYVMGGRSLVFRIKCDLSASTERGIAAASSVPD